MAIDTEDKRRSAAPHLWGIPGMGTAPVPNTDIDAGDREHFAGFYRGISAAGPVVGAGGVRKSMLLHVYNR